MPAGSFDRAVMHCLAAQAAQVLLLFPTYTSMAATKFAISAVLACLLLAAFRSAGMEPVLLR